MNILSVDTSCDDSSVAIVDSSAWKLLGESTISHTSPMQRFGGIVPEIASREHLKALPMAVNQALTQAQLTLRDIDWFSVTNRPGLIGALLVGVSYVKAMAFAAGKPFSVENHIEGHAVSPLLSSFSGVNPPPFPWLSLVVSGGHTELFRVNSSEEIVWLGGTLDDAAGEAFDKVGKLLGLPYPAGPLIDKWVRESATPEDRRLPFPRARVEENAFSFSGLKTAVALYCRKQTPLSESEKLKIAASAQEAIVEMLVEKCRAVGKAQGISQIVVAGGVACNSRLRALIPEGYFPHPRHCTDNASMIALLTALKAKSGNLTAAPWTATAHSSLES